MGKWTIDKQIDFCYGHRVWTQQLEAEFCESGDTSCKCRHLHGHQGNVHVFLEGDNLTRGMVTDFKHLGWLKNFIDNNLDHKFIVDNSDPLFQMMIGYELDLEPIFVPDTDHLAGMVIDMDSPTLPAKPGTPEYEYLEGFFIVDFTPTSENLCKWLFDVASVKMARLGVKVARIDWWETPKSRSSYSGE